MWTDKGLGQFWNWLAILELGLLILKMELKFGTKKLNPEINLQFTFLIQK